MLGELDRRMGAEVAGFWRSLADRVPSSEFRRLVVEAFPEIVTPYVSAAADLGTVWYNSQPSAVRFSATPAELPPVERLQGSASWALSVGSGENAIALLAGAAERALFDGLRQTVVDNVAREPGARWARHASANACGFCRMIATRHVGEDATFYSSAEAASRVVGRKQSAMAAFNRAPRKTRGSGELGDKYHDNCHCVAVMIRPGQDYTPPAYVEQWNRDYIEASKQSRDPNAIALLMNPNRH